ncbi:MAG TPA: GAF domain-containing protein [Kofleriaceae bacterium]|nr:GAF domain-containing protein [Kofleriaceae bacterium]
MAAERLRRLQTLADELAAALRVEDVARVVVAAGIAAIGADAAAIWCVDGSVARLLASADPSHDDLYCWIQLDVSTPVTQVVATGKPVWIETRDEYGAQFPVLESLTREATIAMQAFCVVPLASPKAVHGAVGLTFKQARAFDPAERDYLTSFARHAAIAYERAQLYEDLERKQRTAESTAQRLEKLREATAALSRSRTAAEVAETTVRVGCEAVSAAAATIWFIDADGSLRLAASHGLPEAYLEPWRVIGRDDEMPVARVAKSGVAVWVEDANDFATYGPEIYPRAREAGRLWPFTVLPLSSGGRLHGALSLSFATPVHRFADDEREFLYGLAHTCEQALERTRLLESEAEGRKAAEAANQRKDEFLAMLGHELRNPLAAMVAAIDLIKLRENGALGRELSVVDRSLTHLTHLVTELLDVSRITLGKIRLDRVAFDVARAVEEAIEAVRSTLEANRHYLLVNVPEGLVVDADRDRFAQVLVNLLSNAIQYTPPGGRIELIARDEGMFARVEVKDTGVGITSELIPVVFDAFVQGPRTIDRRQGGLGIGLTVVKRLVELHGGGIEVHSDGENAGTTVTLHWPKASRATSTAKVPALTRPERLRILLVDHNVEAALAFARAVEEMGHLIVVAHDADEALRTAESFEADVIFFEIGLPGRDGYELASQLRALPTCRHSRFIAVGDVHDHERGAKAGVALHVMKPVELSLLASLLTPPE